MSSRDLRNSKWSRNKTFIKQRYLSEDVLFTGLILSIVTSDSHRKCLKNKSLIKLSGFFTVLITLVNKNVHILNVQEWQCSIFIWNLRLSISGPQDEKKNFSMRLRFNRDLNNKTLRKDTTMYGDMLNMFFWISVTSCCHSKHSKYWFFFHFHCFTYRCALDIFFTVNIVSIIFFLDERSNV